MWRRGMFIVKAADGTIWVRASLVMARKFAWHKSWGYPRGELLEIFKGDMLIATQTIWRAFSGLQSERQR